MDYVFEVKEMYDLKEFPQQFICNLILGSLEIKLTTTASGIWYQTSTALSVSPKT